MSVEATSAVWRGSTLESLLTDARSGFASGEDPPDGIIQVRMNNITTEGQFDWSKIRRVPVPTRGIDDLTVEPGDILFNHTNSPDLVGKAAYFPGHSEPVTFSNHFLRLRPQLNMLDGRYLARWLAYQWQRRTFQGMCRQWVNQATVSKDHLLALCLPLPSLEGQRRIAAILDAADALRVKRRAALAKLDTLAQSIFIEMFGDPAVNPKGWRVQCLGDLAIKFSDGPFGSNLKTSHYVPEGVRVIRLQNIGVGEFLDHDRAFIAEKHFENLLKHECLPGDVLVGTLGDPNLRACIQPNFISRALNKADCVQIRANPAIATPEFICALLNMPSTEKMAYHLTLGQTRLRISMGRLRELEIPVPPIEQQKKFSVRISALADMKEKSADSLSHIDRLFASLQHRAFRGEL